MRNWKTTSAGVVAVLAGIVALIQLVTGELSPEAAWPIISAAIAAVAAGLGLTVARDDDAAPTPVKPEPGPGVNVYDNGD